MKLDEPGAGRQVGHYVTCRYAPYETWLAAYLWVGGYLY
jgi:hypothetical protein